MRKMISLFVILLIMIYMQIDVYAGVMIKRHVREELYSIDIFIKNPIYSVYNFYDYIKLSYIVVYKDYYYKFDVDNHSNLGYYSLSNFNSLEYWPFKYNKYYYSYYQNDGVLIK